MSIHEFITPLYLKNLYVKIIRRFKNDDEQGNKESCNRFRQQTFGPPLMYVRVNSAQTANVHMI